MGSEWVQVFSLLFFLLVHYLFTCQKSAAANNSTHSEVFHPAYASHTWNSDNIFTSCQCKQHLQHLSTI